MFPASNTDPLGPSAVTSPKHFEPEGVEEEQSTYEYQEGVPLVLGKPAYLATPICIPLPALKIR